MIANYFRSFCLLCSCFRISSSLHRCLFYTIDIFRISNLIFIMTIFHIPYVSCRLLLENQDQVGGKINHHYSLAGLSHIEICIGLELNWFWYWANLTFSRQTGEASLMTLHLSVYLRCDSFHPRSSTGRFRGDEKPPPPPTPMDFYL